MKINFVLAVCLTGLVLINGCSAKKNFGKIIENHAVTSIFRSHTIYENYNYFYYGIFEEPDVLLGIDKQYTVQSKLWTPVDLSPELLENWIIELDRLPADRNFTNRYMGRYQGAYILAPDGKNIGMWYSKLDWGAFEFPDEKTIIPYAPSLRPGFESRRFRND